MAINILKLKRPCHFSLKRVCSFAYQVFRRMSFVCCVLRTCVRRFCNTASLIHPASRNIFIADVDEVTCSENTSYYRGSSNMADTDATLQSQVLKRMVSFKRKLFGNSSILPSAILEMVTTKSGSVLSQQSNSLEMPDDCSTSQKCVKLEHMCNVTTPESKLMFISEGSRPQLSISEDHCKSPESWESDTLLLEDELSALFDSDSQRETNTNAATSSGKKRRKKQTFSKKSNSKLSPNYFIAIQITSLDIHKRVGEIQEYLLKQNELLKPLMIALPTLHLTLLVMHLSDDMQISRAKIALDECCKAVFDLSMKLPTWCISGVDHFRNAVVFAKVQEDEEFDQLHAIANATSDYFRQHGLLSEYSDTKSFHPHLTIMKLSKAPRLRKQGIKKLEKSLYEEHGQMFFGYQPIASLQLCSMNASKDRKTGYYKIMHEVQLRTA